MSDIIYKFPLSVVDEQEIQIPVGAKILCVQTQIENPCLWAMVNPNAPYCPRKIRIIGTGNTIDHPVDAGRYIGTFQICRGLIVWHVFDSTVTL